jgi:hypothetical protein
MEMPFNLLNIIFTSSTNIVKKINIINALEISYNLFNIIMLSVNFFCNISSYDILAYITKNYIALIYYAKITILALMVKIVYS